MNMRGFRGRCWGWECCKYNTQNQILREKESSNEGKIKEKRDRQTDFKKIRRNRRQRK